MNIKKLLLEYPDVASSVLTFETIFNSKVKYTIKFTDYLITLSGSFDNRSKLNQFETLHNLSVQLDRIEVEVTRI